MKVALFEVSHWHFPLYSDAIKEMNLEVVAISDKNPDKAQKIAKLFGCPFFINFRELLDQVNIDFAFAFGSHSEMPAIGKALTTRGIPFSIEKPCGKNADDVKKLRSLVEKQKIFVTIPFIFRCSDLIEKLKYYEGTIPSDFHHFCFRFIAGSPSRYNDAACKWMLNPDISGGGCTINLAVHFIDFFLLLTGQDVQTVYAKMSNLTHQEAIEDYSIIVLTTRDGRLGIIETGYIFPNGSVEKREFYFSIASAKNYFRSTHEGIRITSRLNKSPEPIDVPISLDTDVFYPVFVKETINRFKKKRNPIADLADMQRVMEIIDAAYKSASIGRPIEIP
jgi:predicted dehydrogenase